MAIDEKDKRTLLLEEQRHSEIINVLKGLPAAINQKNDNKEVSKAIEGNTKELGNFGNKLSQLQVNVEAPNVTLTTDQQKVIEAIQGLKEQGSRIEKLLAEQNEYFKEMCRPKEYEFDFTRNNINGAMQSPIRAKEKYPKPKAQA